MELGNRELGGTRDLINQYRLWPYYEFFCKKPLPVSISETHYLHNVVGDTKVRKGEGMELDQLCQNPQPSEKKTSLSPFDLDVLSEAFHMREMSPFHLSSVRFLIFCLATFYRYVQKNWIIQNHVSFCYDKKTCYANVLYTGQKGLLNAVLKSENQSRDHEKKKKKVNDKGENCKKQKHRLHRVNNGSCIENIRVKPHDPHPLQLKNHQNKVCSLSIVSNVKFYANFIVYINFTTLFTCHASITNKWKGLVFYNIKIWLQHNLFWTTYIYYPWLIEILFSMTIFTFDLEFQWKTLGKKKGYFLIWFVERIDIN